MKSENSNNDSASKLDSDKTGSQNSRRRWLKITTMAAPGLLMLASRPALAQTCSISGFMSATVGTSLTNYDPASCGAWSPGAWKQYNRGKIGSVNTEDAWLLTGVNTGTAFASVFSTANTSLTITKLVDGVAELTPVSFSSQFPYSLVQMLDNALAGTGGDLKSITQHATASYLNAAFIANGAGGGTLAAWMLNYMTPDEVVGLYLLYEISLVVPQDPGVTFKLEKNGIEIANSANLTESDYNAHFYGLSNDGAL
jgi:hypothetical protein